jgi:hypothetical protein
MDLNKGINYLTIIINYLIMHKDIKKIEYRVNKITDSFYLFLFWVLTVFGTSVILQVLYYIIKGKSRA